MNRAEFARRARLWRRHRTIQAAALGAAAGLATSCLVVRPAPAAAAVVGALVLIGVNVFLRRRAPPVTAETVAAHLNRLCPTLEESATLWLRADETLTLVERLQLGRLNAAWAELADRATLGCPRAGALRPAIALGTAAVLALAVVAGWPRVSGPVIVAAPAASAIELATAKIAAPALRSAALTIASPAYLGAGARHVAGLDAEVAAGSLVTWELEFTGGVTGVTLTGAGPRDHVSAEAVGGGRFRARTTITETRVYQLAITGADGAPVVWPEIHALKAIRDQPPRLTWQEPAAARTIVDPGTGRPILAVRLGAIDDHGVAEVKLVMTVARGTGEGVKFREQEISLEPGTVAIAGGDTFGRMLDLAALGLEPGDELYFYALATDRRTPEPNRTRSETRFVILRGPETVLTAPGIAVAGVNRLPPYFRSQRQLIIDTERLLADRPALTDAAFLERSEDIGVDQKLLRLRYGQFLGEEFEPAAGGAPREAQAMALAGTLRGQPRAAASRAAAVERAVEAQHQHPNVTDRDGRPPTFEELMAPFLHQHDNAEAATLFDTHVKAALRGVLAAMWEAEGFLRTGRPTEALPAENRALELLKALQQADRLYVKRVGYEPAPLKIAERRLRGELDAIPQRAQDQMALPEKNAAAITLATALTAMGHAAEAPLTAEGAAMVDSQLVAAARERPETFIGALEIWRRRMSGLTAGDRDRLRQALWSLLPPAQEKPRRSAESAPALARDYFEALWTNEGGAR